MDAEWLGGNSTGANIVCLRSRALTRRSVLRGGAVAPLLSVELSSGASASSPESGFDANRLPFSRYGSYWAVSKRWEFGAPKEIPAGEWYIRLLEDDVAPNELFRLELRSRDHALPFRGTLTPAQLSLTAASNSVVDFVIAEPDVLRIRGRNCTLRLFGIKGSYGYAIAHPDGSWEVMADVAMPRVQIRTSFGSLRLVARTVGPGAVQSSRCTLDRQAAGRLLFINRYRPRARRFGRVRLHAALLRRSATSRSKARRF